MSRSLIVNTPTPTGDIKLNERSIVINSDVIGVHPNLNRTTLYSNIVTEQTGFGLYDIPFNVIRTHDSGCTWMDCEPSNGEYVFDRMHALLDPLIAAGKKILYVITDTPHHAIAGNIKQRWTPNRALVTGNALSNMVFPTVLNRNSRMYEVTTAGTSGTSEPVWPTTVGATVNAVGGTAVFTCRAFPIGSTSTPSFSTTKAGNVSYPLAGAPMAAYSVSLRNYINAVFAEFGNAIYGFEYGNESGFDMIDNNVLPGWPAFNISDEETYVSNAYVAKAAIEALPTTRKILLGGSGWVNNPNEIDNYRRFLSARDPITGKFGYEIGWDFHSFHVYGNYDIGRYGISGQIAGAYNNLKQVVRRYTELLNEYGITNPQFRITEYGITGGNVTTNSGTYPALMALSTANQLIVLKMRVLCALSLNGCIGMDFYSHASTADYNTNFRTVNSPIRQLLAWLYNMYAINWVRQNPLTGQITVNYQNNGNLGANITETYNYPAGWPQSNW